MAQILDTQSNLEKTIRIFDAFYKVDLVVNGNEYDIVFGYFKSINKSNNISSNFTSILFRISQETNVPVLDILGYIKGTTKLEMNKVLAYYLNSFKSKTTLYGISAVPLANQSVARNIVI